MPTKTLPSPSSDGEKRVPPPIAEKTAAGKLRASHLLHSDTDTTNSSIDKDSILPPPPEEMLADVLNPPLDSTDAPEDFPPPPDDFPLPPPSIPNKVVLTEAFSPSCETNVSHKKPEDAISTNSKNMTNRNAEGHSAKLSLNGLTNHTDLSKNDLNIISPSSEISLSSKLSECEETVLSDEGLGSSLALQSSMSDSFEATTETMTKPLLNSKAEEENKPTDHNLNHPPPELFHTDTGVVMHSGNGTLSHSAASSSPVQAGKTTSNLLGETITVQLRPVKNDNRKADYSAPKFDRTPEEMKRVTFQDSQSSQQIKHNVPVQRSAKEQERIKKTGLSEDDVAQAEIFYKGHKSEVFVCPCLATLYFAEAINGESVNLNDWKPEHIGIPVLIYDSGDGKRSRGITFVFAEKGTGFSLWKTAINYQSNWEIVEPVFQRLKVYGSNDKIAGIAYQDEASAKAFYQRFKECTSDPELNVLGYPNSKQKKIKENRKSKKGQTKLPRKTDISGPCQFLHITQLKQSVDGILANNMVDDESASSEDGTIISK